LILRLYLKFPEVKNENEIFNYRHFHKMEMLNYLAGKDTSKFSPGRWKPELTQDLRNMICSGKIKSGENANSILNSDDPQMLKFKGYPQKKIQTYLNAAFSSIQRGGAQVQSTMPAKRTYDESKEDNPEILINQLKFQETADYQNIPYTLGTYHDLNQLLEPNKIVVSLLLPIGLIEGSFLTSVADGSVVTIEFDWPQLTIDTLTKLFRKEHLAETSPRKLCLIQGLKDTRSNSNYAKGKIEVDLPFEVLTDQRFILAEIISQGDKLFVVVTLTKKTEDAREMKKELDTKSPL
jgi:hypothetical protein